jgi:hypothetical protein
MSLQVVFAAHVFALPPHCTVQSVGPLQMTLHVALPLQLVVQPLFGHVTLHVLLPVQSTVEPVSTFRSHVLFPSQVTVLVVPVDKVH